MSIWTRGVVCAKTRTKGLSVLYCVVQSPVKTNGLHELRWRTNRRRISIYAHTSRESSFRHANGQSRMTIRGFHVWGYKKQSSNVSEDTISQRYSDPVTLMKERGLIQGVTNESISSAAQSSDTPVYCGFDPTARSLHVGNLLQIVGLLHFWRCGHSIVALLGGATASIGDPSGRSTERPLLDHAQLALNTASIEHQLQSLLATGMRHIVRKKYGACTPLQHLSRGGEPPEDLPTLTIANNHSWHSKMSFLDFLRDIGRHARVGTMLSRESVKSRMDQAEGLSFTEFSYQLLQGYDFYYMNAAGLERDDPEAQPIKVKVQMGGSDQWGNIVAGVELIRRKRALSSSHSKPADSSSSPSVDTDETWGVTLPLVTTATGEKFGKSAGNAVWLDSNMVSHFDFYQFFRRTPDSEVERYLKYFTFLPLSEIEEVMAEHAKAPNLHLPQRTLAAEVTEMVHGPTALRAALLKTRLLFDSTQTDADGIATPLTSFPPEDILAAFENDPRLARLQKEAVVGQEVVRVAASAGVAKSKTQALKLLTSGGLYINDTKCTDETRRITDTDLIGGRVIVLRTGKSNNVVVEVL
ncbi:hypothetical protein M427DRAFT_125900 [Gonapodya prolifera JEL478]|uniref:tyrosine--tRNA ligase n=1 Tax=Gonapodya prolifera (strain JEL478) TaxID=1344416 RepID=A0A139A6G5_GONPJ|nr:hypothetical protein M427DRAFT_125900 [Gonapodya prolifera JEL478]|eukprot:KXS12351.1 hypothetical protein M427DRAFT_125900 [Gonapodya prolifera JEL478]